MKVTVAGVPVLCVPPLDTPPGTIPPPVFAALPLGPIDATRYPGRTV